MVCPQKARRRGKLQTPRRLQSGARWGCPQTLDNLFYQLKTNCENQIITRASKTAHSDNKVIAQHCQFCINARKRPLRKIDCVRCVSATQFADTSAYGKGEVARFYNMRALLRGPPKSQQAKQRDILGEEEQQVYEGVAASFARRLPSVALLRRALRGKPLGFPLKLTTFCFVSSKQKV